MMCKHIYIHSSCIVILEYLEYGYERPQKITTMRVLSEYIYIYNIIYIYMQIPAAKTWKNRTQGFTNIWPVRQVRHHMNCFFLGPGTAKFSKSTPFFGFFWWKTSAPNHLPHISPPSCHGWSQRPSETMVDIFTCHTYEKHINYLSGYLCVTCKDIIDIIY